MLSCELIKQFGRLEELSDDWDRLWRSDPSAEIFQSFPWVKAWWLSYGHTVELFTFCVCCDNTVIGFVPLVRRGETLQFLGQQQSDYCDIVCQEQLTLPVVTTSLRELLKLPGWKTCILQNLKSNGRLLSRWQELPPELRSCLQVFPGEDCKTLLLEANREMLDSLINKDHTRRRLNKLRKAGSLTFRHLEDKQEAQRHLNQFFKHHVRRHVLLGKTSSSESPEFRKLLRTLVDELDLSSCVRFGVLELNASALAWHFSFQVNGKLVFYQQTFDVEAWDYAPGEVLTHQLLLYGRQNLDREIDFTRGDEAFKARFTTQTRPNYSVYVDRPDSFGRVRQLGRATTFPLIRLGRIAVKLTKKNPRVFRAYRSARLCIKGLLASAREDKPTSLSQRINGLFRRGLRLADLDKKEIEVFVVPVMATLVNREVRLLPREASFGDLVDVSKANPGVVTPFELGKYKQRLKRGDRVFLLTENDKLVLGAWMNGTQPNDIFSLKLKSNVVEWCYDMLVYDWWATHNAKGNDFQSMVQFLLEISRLKCKDGLAVCCPATLDQLRAELLNCGSTPQYRLSRRTLSRWFRIRSVASGERAVHRNFPSPAISLGPQRQDELVRPLPSHGSTVISSHSHD